MDRLVNNAFAKLLVVAGDGTYKTPRAWEGGPDRSMAFNWPGRASPPRR